MNGERVANFLPSSDHSIMRTSIFLFLALLLTGTVGHAGDWPTWRHDAARGGGTPDALPAQLHLLWSRDLPPQRSAWPTSQNRLQFDASYEPVVAGKRLFIGSGANDAITAFDTETGNELWRFYTDGPIRFAPAIHRDKLFAVSDDGHLYCLDAATGKLQWKVRGGPGDQRVLGNDRLVSLWPARGGPVVADGKVFFAASLWPFMGIFVHAVDAETGKVVWTNSEMGSKWTVHPHGAPSFGSVVPQGYLAISGDSLIVPGGRSLPAVFDVKTGALKHFAFEHKVGDFRVIAGPDAPFYFVAANRFDLLTGKKLGTTDAAVISGDTLVHAAGKDPVLAASSVRGTPKEVTKRDIFGKTTTTIEYESKSLWKINIDAKLPRQPMLMAGTRVYTGGEDVIASFESKDATNSPPANVPPTQPVWKGAIDGTPWSLIAADDKLFVMTENSRLYCFAGKAGTAVHHARPAHAAKEPATPSAQHERVAALLKHVDGPAAGYAVVMGIETGDLVEELLHQSTFHVIAIDPDAVKVDALRRRLDAAGVYGWRVGVHVGEPATFPLPPYLATLIVSERGELTDHRRAGDALASVLTALRPFGGVACLPLSLTAHHDWVEAKEKVKLGSVGVSRIGGDTLLRRIGAPAGTAPWTHQYGDAANTLVSNDNVVKTPLGLLWFGGPSNDRTLPRHGHGPTPQVAGGRAVTEGPNTLRAMDIYTGRLLWERTFRDIGKYYNTTKHFPGAGEIGSNYVTTPQRIYVVHNGTLVELDAATGQTVREMSSKISDEPGDPFGYLAVDEDVIVTTIRPVSLWASASNLGGVKIPTGFKPLIAQGERWHFLAGDDPVGASGPEEGKPGWTDAAFKTKGWKEAKAGEFGEGDDDDPEDYDLSSRSRERYERFYARKTFEGTGLDKSHGIALVIASDEPFIAYLNGVEIARSQIKAGRGPGATGIGFRESSSHEVYTLKDHAKVVRPGINVLAIEAQRPSIGSDAFGVDPFLIVKTEPDPKPVPKPDDKSALPASEKSKTPADAKAPLPDGRGSDKAAEPTKDKAPEKAPEKLKDSGPYSLSKAPSLLTGSAAATTVDEALQPVRYAALSKTLAIWDRATGKPLWTRRATIAFRHNAIVAGGGKLFCIDGISAYERFVLERRDIPMPAKPRLIALDARTGRELWASDVDIFGTFLSYSAEHDILIEGGSSNRDRPWYEADQGLIAYRGSTGQVLWREKATRYQGPVLIWRDRIITNGSTIVSFDLKTGKKLAFGFKRQYGCNTIIGSQNLLTFRSGAAGFFDLANDSGVGNIGGFRSSCTSNLIVADGVLSAPEYTRTCTCTYQNQTSLALIHMPQVEQWTYSEVKPGDGPIQQIGINLGAPGDRRGPSGALWMEFPGVGIKSGEPAIRLEGANDPVKAEATDKTPLPDGRGSDKTPDKAPAADRAAIAEPSRIPASPSAPVKVDVPTWRAVTRHASVIEAGELPWVAASQVQNLRALVVTLEKNAKEPRRYTLRLVFAELDDVKPGERVFDVIVQGKPVLSAFDVVREAGGPRRSLVKEIRGVAVTGDLRIELKQAGTLPAMLSGVEIVAEK